MCWDGRFRPSTVCTKLLMSLAPLVQSERSCSMPCTYSNPGEFGHACRDPLTFEAAMSLTFSSSSLLNLSMRD